MPRVSARAKPRRRVTVEELRQIALALTRRSRRTCSSDLARKAGCTVGRARGALDRLERLGAMQSVLEPAPGTGLGRRWYWRAGTLSDRQIEEALERGARDAEAMADALRPMGQIPPEQMFRPLRASARRGR